MNIAFAKEVGLLRYVRRRIIWKCLQRFGLPRDYALPTGLRLPLPAGNYFASDVFVTDGNVDWNAEHILTAYLREHGAGRDFFDVGAHIGYYSLLCSPLVRQAYAFEPDSRNHDALSRTNARTSNIEVIHQAVADHDGTVSFVKADVSSVSHIAEGGEDSEHSVPMVKLDTFAAKRDLNPAAVKVDTEGFDILVLEGALRVAREKRPVFLIEFNLEGNRPNSFERLQAFTESAGMSVWAIVRTALGALSWTFSLRKVQVEELPELCTKMLFLVPREDTWFPAFAQKHPQWSAKELRPGGRTALFSLS